MGTTDNINIQEFIQQIQELYKSQQSATEQAPTPTFSGFQIPIKSSFNNSGGFDPTGKGNVGRVHQGVDLRAPGGTSIYPIAPGVVTAVQPDPKGGNTVNIKHSGGVTSYYAHMGTIAVHPKDIVNIDTVIGTVGASGNAKGFPHLHLQIWKSGQLIDPASIISIPVYTAFNPKTEKLWLPNAQQNASAWNIQSHLASKNANSGRADKLLSLAAQYYKLSQD